MKTNLKKLLPMIGVMLTSLTLVHADDMDSYNSNSTAATKVNPAVNQPNENAYGGFIWGEYLYWVVNEESSVGVSGIYDPSGTSSPEKGKVLYPNFKGLNGFNVGLGLMMDHDNWDLYVDYTWLQQNTKSNHSLYSSADGASTAYGAFTSYADLVDEINTSWKYQFNNVDLDCGRDFFVGHYFALRPHAGFKFAWTTKSLNTNYIVDGTLDSIESKNHQSFWGVGVRAGVDPTFYMSDSWQFFCTTAVAFPWSQFHVRQTLVDNTDESAELTLQDFHNSFWMVAPVLESSLGLRWKAMFGDNNCYGFGLQVGWDSQVWFNQTNWVAVDSIYTPVQAGSLTQQGLTVRAQFNF